jgi:hypothetical protein
MAQVVGIIDTIDHLPLGILQPKLDGNGPYAYGSSLTLSTWLDGATTRQVNDTWGVVVQINGAIAPALGRQVGYDDGAAVNADEYDLRIVQVAVQHQLLGGAWIISQLEDVHYAPFMVRWAEATPGRLGLYVSPTWSVDLYYLTPL